MAWCSSSWLVMGRLKLRLTQVSCFGAGASSSGRQAWPRSSRCSRRPTTPHLARSSPLGMSRRCRALLTPRRRHQWASCRPIPQTSSIAMVSSQRSGLSHWPRSNIPAWSGVCLARRLASLAWALLAPKPMAIGRPRFCRARARSWRAQPCRSPSRGRRILPKASSIEYTSSSSQWASSRLIIRWLMSA